MRRRTTFSARRSFDRVRNWRRQQCATDCVDRRSQSTCGSTCYDIWLYPDQEGNVPDDGCEPMISESTLGSSMP
eukprot:1207174-Pyramimonas_sp.AAC.1